MKDDNKYHLLGKNIGGHFSYLTVNILYTHCAYWLACLATEIAWEHGYGRTSKFTRQLVYFTHMFASISAALGIVLTILYLKFNYFEPKWRETVLKVYRERGHHMFEIKSLFVHLNQFPIALCDLFIIKNEALLKQYTPTTFQILVFAVLYTLAYVSWTHLNHYITGGYYPYPFLEKAFASWNSEISFVAGIIFFVTTCTIICRAIAVRQLPEYIIV